MGLGDEREEIFGHMEFGITIPGGLTYIHACIRGGGWFVYLNSLFLQERGHDT